MRLALQQRLIATILVCLFGGLRAVEHGGMVRLEVVFVCPQLVFRVQLVLKPLLVVEHRGAVVRHRLWDEGNALVLEYLKLPDKERVLRCGLVEVPVSLLWRTAAEVVDHPPRADFNDDLARGASPFIVGHAFASVPLALHLEPLDASGEISFGTHSAG